MRRFSRLCFDRLSMSGWFHQDPLSLILSKHVPSFAEGSAHQRWPESPAP